MIDSINNLEAEDDFDKAYLRHRISVLLAIITPMPSYLLSFGEVKAMLKPDSQRYLGILSVPVDLIIGSEERYSDFDSTFLPRSKRLKSRWVSVDKAYLGNILLPPVELYRLGGIYFVRDGHHRISVAKTRRVIYIDAEVTELSSIIKLDVHTTIANIKDQLLWYERQLLFNNTKIDTIIDMDHIYFTEPSSYKELLLEIMNHRHLLSLNKREQVTLDEAIKSWFTHCYQPIITLIHQEKLIKLLPQRTLSDLYLWVNKSWYKIKNHYTTIEVSTVVKYLKKSYLFTHRR